MPSGVYVRTKVCRPSEETKRKMSNSRKDFFQTKEGKERARKHSDDLRKFYQTPEGKKAKRKISKSSKGHISSNRGRSCSEETKKKISESKKGTTPWNRGIPGLSLSLKNIKEI